MAEWVADQGQLLLALLEEHQYLVLALAVGFEAVGLPLPISAEIVVVTMGFQIYRGEANPWAVMGTVVASATVGVSVQYWIARGVGRPLLDRYGRILRIRPSHLERLERWFARRDVPVVVIGRVVPAIRIIIPVVAGGWIHIPSATDDPKTPRRGSGSRGTCVACCCRPARAG